MNTSYKEKLNTNPTGIGAMFNFFQTSVWTKNLFLLFYRGFEVHFFLFLFFFLQCCLFLVAFSLHQAFFHDFGNIFNQDINGFESIVIGRYGKVYI